MLAVEHRFGLINRSDELLRGVGNIACRDLLYSWSAAV
jgi:hypothetical protein